MIERRAGLLLHPTSLPGPFGIGDLGPASVRFLDWLESAGQTVWQLLPLNAVGLGDSPYGPVSAYAGNPLLISPEALADDGLTAAGELQPPGGTTADRVDYGAVGEWKETLLRRAWEAFRRLDADSEPRRAHRVFVQAPAQGVWLDDWTLFAALKRRHGGASWLDWGDELRLREPRALARARTELGDEIEYHAFVQFLFFRQWEAVRAEASRRGIRLLGDLPIYMALDSADVWAHRELFDLDESGRPRTVAGVPPDYFSADGQLWGNPLYRWDRMQQTGFVWWIERIRANLRFADLVRIDHFRGLVAYWEVDASEPSAAGGRWRPGPGEELFRALTDALGELPLIAEDLGVITADVERLRQTLSLPGMKVLQFAFDEIGSDHAPHRLRRDCVVYTGTHDNDTARGWLATAEAASRQRALDYLGARPETFHWDLLRAAWASPGLVSIAPLQDVLGLGSEARMNLPGSADGNWNWRLAEASLLTPELAGKLRRLTEITERLPAPPAEPARTAP